MFPKNSPESSKNLNNRFAACSGLAILGLFVVAGLSTVVDSFDKENIYRQNLERYRRAKWGISIDMSHEEMINNPQKMDMILDINDILKNFEIKYGVVAKNTAEDDVIVLNVKLFEGSGSFKGQLDKNNFKIFLQRLQENNFEILKQEIINQEEVLMVKKL